MPLKHPVQLVSPSLRWSKIRNISEPSSIGPTIILTSCDDVICFHDINTDERTYYRASGGQKGNGTTSVVGHALLPIFAFSELCIKPRIFIVTFNDFRLVNILKSNHHEHYKNIRFSETEYLFALSGLPNYTLEIWNWRLGKLMGCIDTGMSSPSQIIRLSRSSPLMVGQYAKESGQFVIWEIHLSMEQAYIIKRPTTIDFLNRDVRISYTFGIDNNVYMADNIGSLYCVVPQIGIPKLLWKCDEDDDVGPYPTLVIGYKGGFVLHSSFGIVSFVKKQAGTYTSLWRISPLAEIISLRALNNQLYGIAINDSYEILDKPENVNKKLENEDYNEKLSTDIRNIEIIYPDGRYMVMVLGVTYIELIEITSGKVVTTTQLKNIVTIKSHPHYPYIVIGDQAGAITYLSFHNPSESEFITKFNLTDTWIHEIQFTPCGDVLVVSDQFRDFFIITGHAGVAGHFNFEFVPLCFCVQKLDDSIDVMILSAMGQGSTNQIASNKVRRVTLKTSSSSYERTTTTINLSNHYTSLRPLATNPKQYIGTVYLKRDIHILENRRGAAVMETIHVLVTYAQLPYVELNVDVHFVLTWSIDGIVCIFDANTKQLDSIFLAQNRYAHRIRKVVVSPAKRYAISLSTLGNLKCFEMETNSENDRKIAELTTKQTAEIIEDIFTKYRKAFNRKGEDVGKTWLDLKSDKELDTETALYKDKRQQIYEDFLTLKENLQKLIDTNEDLSPAERLPLNNFNLNKEWAESLYEIARQERESEEKTLKAYVADQNRITHWIIDNTWNLMKTHGRKIRGMFSYLNCENYPLIYEDKSTQKDISKVQLWLSTEHMVAKKDKFQAWIPCTAEKMMTKVQQEPEIEEDLAHTSFSSRDTVSSDSTQSFVKHKKQKNYSLQGTSTHNFIDPCPQRYEQMDVVTFQQTFVEKILGGLDMYNLRVFFNTQFDELYKFKEDQMYQVKKRNNRLKEIQSELNILEQLRESNKLYNEIITDPEYKLDEQPERIIEVDDSEVKIAPYISPSRQRLLDEEALQLELRRLELLADDFRERALLAMMDGVLEKRWEDEIKKTPPPPECISSGKRPEELTKDDMRAIQEYEAQLKALNAERDKYRNMMLDEKIKLQQIQNETIMRFNMKCATLFIEKHKIDAAIRQEELKLLRNSLNNYDRILHKRKEYTYSTDIAEEKKNVDKLILTIEDLDKRVADCKSRYEQLQSRDRLLDRQFKSQFGENAPSIVVDQAYKIFKKRPKWMARAWATAAILQDMANRVIAKNSTKSGPPIPEECYEFLTLVDSLDNLTVAPNSIAPNLWTILCNLRRHKIESEFKLKAQGIQLAEAEATLNAFNKELTSMKTRITELEKQRDDIRQIFYTNMRNRYVQLVLPRGLIEVPLTGHMEDFKGTILLHTTDVHDINSVIKKAGTIKLKTMNRSAVFRRKIIYQEWEHKMLQMEVKSMQEDVAVVEKCKVTKEIQMYLKRKEMKLPDDLSQSAQNREIESTKAYLKRTLDDMKRTTDQLTNQLSAKKRENKYLDAEISRINIQVTEQNQLRDCTWEEQQEKEDFERLAIVVERSKLIRKVQAQHAQILELATMLELQRLRTYPTLHAPKTNPFS